MSRRQRRPSLGAQRSLSGSSSRCRCRGAQRSSTPQLAGPVPFTFLGALSAIHTSLSLSPPPSNSTLPSHLDSGRPRLQPRSPAAAAAHPTADQSLPQADHVRADVGSDLRAVPRRRVRRVGPRRSDPRSPHVIPARRCHSAVATALRLAYTVSGGNAPLCHTAADRSVCSGDKAHARHGMAPALDVRWLQPGRRLVILTAERLVRALHCSHGARRRCTRELAHVCAAFCAT